MDDDERGLQAAARRQAKRCELSAINRPKPVDRDAALVSGRLFHMIDDEDFDGTFGRFEFQSELFL
jgi:hypothetical protein